MNGMDFALPLAGGALIGLASVGLLLFTGRIAGISGILGGALAPTRGGRGETGWRVAFLGGLVAGGALLALTLPGAFANGYEPGTASLAVAGLLVGFGTRLGSGCTSGHGVCGIGRLSRRSIVATVTFMVTGVVATYFTLHVL